MSHTSVGGRLSTDTAYLKDLIADIGKGEIKIPKFQRPFVWRAEQAFDLLDSIASSYPVGSLLFWKTHDKLVAERNIGDFRLPKTDDLTPTTYVLDGQQRLTVVYSCLGAAPDEQGFSAAYDLLGEMFIDLPAEAPLHVFPLRLTYRTSDFLNYRTALQAHPRHDDLQPRLDALIDAISRYKIPVVTLKELTVEEVCPIFERINNSGTRLSTYDLMVAATWTRDFNLDDETQLITDALAPKGFGDIDKDTVLKCLSAIRSQSIKKEDVLRLRKLPAGEMEDLVARARDSLLRVVDLLATEFGIYSWDFLPYEAFVVALSVVMARGEALTAEQLRRVRMWFWRSAFDERYRGASEHFVSKDIAALSEFIGDGKSPADTFGPAPTADVFVSTAFRSNNSRSRALVLALASRKPRNLTNGAAIDCAEALSAFNKKQFHHIQPRAHLARAEAEGEHNCLANICLLAASENRFVSDADPRVYLPRLLQDHGSEAAAILSCNVMPAMDYSTASFPAFVDARARLLASLAQRLCDGVGHSEEAALTSA
jgi:hypothetical protein